MQGWKWYVSHIKILLSLGLILAASVAFNSRYPFWPAWLSRQASVPAVHYPPGKEPITCYIWLHGTVGSSVNILNPRICLDDTACDETFSVKFSSAYRHHKDIGNDQPIPVDGGIFLLDRLDIDKANAGTLDTTKRGEAVYAIAGAYDVLVNHLDQGTPIRVHALAGWSGLLSQKERRREGFFLYYHLCKLRRQLVHQYGCPIKFVILSHSHGGNVALWMAEAERVQQEGLSIDTLIMLGTPMQRETAHCITSPFFKRILLYSSEGDNIQCLDRFSTAERRSYMRMSDIADTQAFVEEHPGYVRADVQCIVNDKNRHISHVNLWFIRRSQAALPSLWPLPLICTLPVFDEAYLPGLTRYQIRLYDTPETDCCCLETWCEDRWVPLLQKEGLRPLWKSLGDLAWKCWTPVDEQTHIIFNRKNFEGLRHAWRTVRRKIEPIIEDVKCAVEEVIEDATEAR